MNCSSHHSVVSKKINNKLWPCCPIFLWLINLTPWPLQPPREQIKLDTYLPNKQHHTIKLIPTVYYGRQMCAMAPMMSLRDQREWSPINLCDSVMDVIDLLIIRRKWHIPCASSHAFVCHTSVALRNLFCQQPRRSCSVTPLFVTFNRPCLFWLIWVTFSEVSLSWMDLSHIYVRSLLLLPNVGVFGVRHPLSNKSFVCHGGCESETRNTKRHVYESSPASLQHTA